MTLIITATGQSAEIEEVTEGGFYCTVQGHSRFLPVEAVSHPKPACPLCGGELCTVYELFGSFCECVESHCFFTRRTAAHLND